MNPNIFAITAPTTVTVVATDEKTQVITWSAVADATGYEVLQATTEGGPYTVLTDTTATSYTITDLNPNTTYYYKVRAYSSDGAEESTPIAAATPAVGLPTEVTTTTTTTTATFNWVAVTGATVYRIAASPTEDGTFTVIGRVDAPTTTYTVTGLKPGTTAYYKILAYINTTLSSSSNPIAATTQNEPVDPPTNVTASTTNANTALLTWTNPTGIDGVRIYRATNLDGPYTLVGNTTTGTYTDTNLTPNTTYYYTLEAYTGTVDSPRTTPVTITTPIEVSDQLYAYDTQNRCVRLVWILQNEAETVTIERSTVQQGPYTTLATVDEGTNTYLDCTARHGYIYYYRITYLNGATNTVVGPVRVRVPSDPIFIDPQPLCGTTIVTRQTTCCQPTCRPTCCQPTCCNPCCNNYDY